MKTSAVKLVRERGIVVFFSVAIFLFLSYSSRAQDRFSLQFRPGVSFATTDLGDANLKTGLGFEGSMAYRFMPHLAVYAGWGWNRFSADASFAGAKMDFEETGYSFGLQFVHPFSEGFPFDYFVRGGLILAHIELENPQGDIIADSGHGPGFQAEAGLSFPVGERWHFIPGIKYQSLSTEIPIEGLSYPVDLNYLSAGVSLLWSF